MSFYSEYVFCKYEFFSNSYFHVQTVFLNILYCYREHNQSCPTCHNLGLLEYSCSFCIENTCEQETCGNKWDWLNNLEECRQRIVLEETYRVNLDRLSLKFNALIEANVEKFNQLDFFNGKEDDEEQQTIESNNKNVIEMERPVGSASRQQLTSDGKYPLPEMQLQVYCQNQTAEMRDLRCYKAFQQNQNFLKHEKTS